MVEIKNLTKAYGDTIALDNVNLHLQKGKIIGLLGPNGSGKSTLMKVILGLLKQLKSGEVLLNGEKINDFSRKDIAYLPDKNHIPTEWSVQRVCEFYTDFFSDFDLQKAHKLFKDLQIPLQVRIKSLSKGNQEKVSLILTLSRNALLYVLDEPIAGVDPLAREEIFKLILQNHRSDSTILISTHLLLDVEHILDEVIFISYGNAFLHKPLSEITSPTKNLNDAFKEYFG
ncbi:ABC transporter ATP-binding protein [Helicobacter burdigaliensis]|uniref:ABC transporter ATP-binding protein n=1 Tax=Helicobacter burdigaliensis TaxID=2315334 RepID=UPI000EF711E9|nr:ABC transporter ATP-binding protein [Helicobacter burdigaliensis]